MKDHPGISYSEKEFMSVGIGRESKTPTHYDMKIQPVEFIQKNGIGFCAGNAIKYICRYDKKGTPSQDLDKAIHYLEMLKETL